VREIKKRGERKGCFLIRDALKKLKKKQPFDFTGRGSYLSNRDREIERGGTAKVRWRKGDLRTFGKIRDMRDNCSQDKTSTP